MFFSVFSFQRIESEVSLESLDRKESVWINLVWSLAILGKQTEEQVKSILDPNFYTNVLGKIFV